ncbi:MAG: N-acetylmuramoyl-L-alanine amidase [Gemmatimonadetes bacterium]|nr:N-acetylmuramoyl-L-alanine amidase [Gemmatimonadota bacterium]
MRPSGRRARLLMLVVGLAALAPRTATAQSRPVLHVEGGGARWSVSVNVTHGFSAVGATLLDSLGWKVDVLDGRATLDGPGGSHVELRAGTPFFRWNNAVLQLADVPYVRGGALYVPLQLLSDFLPQRLPDSYAFDGDSLTLLWKNAAPATGKPVMLLPDNGTRVVVIDPGHGGSDPGTIGIGGLEEKTVALAIAKDLAADLEKVPNLKVYLTRHTDTLIALWDRGQMATRLKGDRPGVFISIHANSTTSGREARGFETYILSEARTEHERRVAAIENSPLGVDTTAGKASSDLDYILRDMKNLNTQHWSSLLAQMVQDEMAKVDPAPDRGVRQAPLAVITNALMPAVLVEVGYLSNPQDARLLGEKSFRKKVAAAITKAVQDFFGRYPPRSGNAGGENPGGR